jgi:electron transfer flavoprotein alpha subunit
MGEILVVAEHRSGGLRDLTLQMLYKAAELCRLHGHEVSVAVLGDGVAPLAEQLRDRAHRVIVCDDPRLAGFDPDTYRDVLAGLIAERRPLLTLLGHTPWSMDLAPALAVATGYPLATDCVDVLLDSSPPRVVRHVYSGKMCCRMAFREADGYLVTVRGGVFPAAAPGEHRLGRVVGDAGGAGSAEIDARPRPPPPVPARRISRGYVDTGKGEVDIAQAEILVSIGRGIGEEDNVAVMQELAGLLGGTLSCSRPVVDKGWLPKWRQVGTSGKTVKPKVYLALGISGAFQHVAGMSGSETIIAVNRDRRAPIFRVAGYGAVADVLEVAAALRERLAAK